MKIPIKYFYRWYFNLGGNYKVPLDHPSEVHLTLLNNNKKKINKRWVLDEWYKLFDNIKIKCKPQ